MGDATHEIRGVMIPVTGGRLLLPNASVAEVITYSPPETLADMPDWLLGRLLWRGWRLPLLSFSMLSGLTTFEAYNNARVVVLKALGGNPQRPFLGLLAQGFPRLTTITRDLLIENDDAAELPAVKSAITVRDDSALIPDLFAIENLVNEALPSAPVPKRTE